MSIITVEFKSDTVELIDNFVSVKNLCENLGMDNATQYKKIQADDSFQSEFKQIEINGITQKVLCIPYNKVNGWLFSISVNRVKPEVKKKLIEYKNECFNVLHDYFNKGYAMKPEVQEALEKKIKQLEALNPHQINGYKSQLAQRNTKIKQLEASIIDQNKLLAKTPKKDTLSPEDSFLMKEIKSLCMETDDLKMQLSRTNKSFMNDPSMHKDFLEFIYHANKALVKRNTIKHLSPAVEQTYQSLSNSILFITRRYENIKGGN